MSTSTSLVDAEALMAERRFAEAIAAFERHLVAQPQDLKALLKLGICHLLSRSHGAFLEVHRRAEQVIARIGTLPADVVELNELYRNLLVRVGAASLVAGTLVLNPGCTEGKSAGDAVHPGAGADASSASIHRPQHRYSGGVRLERRPGDEVPSPPPPPASSPRIVPVPKPRGDADAARDAVRDGVPADEK